MKTLEGKLKAIDCLLTECNQLTDKLKRISKLPTPKRESTKLKRAGRVIVYSLRIAVIMEHIKMIQTTPIDK